MITNVVADVAMLNKIIFILISVKKEIYFDQENIYLFLSNS